MHVITHFPDGRRDVYQPKRGEKAALSTWAVVVRGRPELGHIAGPDWRVHRYEPTQEGAQGVCRDLERTCSVERAVAVPTECRRDGASYTAIGFWDGAEIQLVGVAPGDLEVTGGEDVSVGGPWWTTVWAPDAEAALVEAYRAMDEAVAAAAEHPAGGQPLSSG